MDTSEFLAHVLPRSGPYCIVSRKDEFPWHMPAEDVDEAAAIVAAQEEAERDVYFAVGALVKAREWNEEKGRWATRRIKSNIRALRAYTMDLDAGPRAKGEAYETPKAALEDLLRFVRHYSLPDPTVVQSGFGLHVYWTLTDEVPSGQWEEYGSVLLSMAQAIGVKVDPARSKDSSSILRVVGTTNRKYGRQVEVKHVGTPTSTDAFHAKLQLHAATPIAANGPAIALPSNIYKEYPRDGDFKTLLTNCQATRWMLENPTATPEPAWSCAIELCAHLDRGREAAHWMSRGDAIRYNARYVDQKYTRLIEIHMGPPSCERIQKAFKDANGLDPCTGCPSRGNITSPYEISKALPQPVPTTALPEQKPLEPPDGYIRTANGIGLETANPKTGVNEVEVFCPYDMYPVRIQRNNTKGEDITTVFWRINLPHTGWAEMRIPVVTANHLPVELQKRGILTKAHHAQLMWNFMSSYIRKLQTERPDEVEYSKLGWHDKGFVLGETLYKADGTTETWHMSAELQAAVKYGIASKGDLNSWCRAIAYYNRPGLENYRCYFYAAVASPLYWMTGRIATYLLASGRGGTGKTTLLDACAAIWGEPESLKYRGTDGSYTLTAIQAASNGLHHLPLLIDEIHNRDPKETAGFIFGYSGGKGKARGVVTGGAAANIATWSNIVLANGNADIWDRIAAADKESQPTMARLMQLEFDNSTTISKEEGDLISELVHANYGLAGHALAAYYAKDEEGISRRVKAVLRDVDKRVNVRSEERYWTALTAVMHVGAEIADSLGLIRNWPISNDIEWMCRKVEAARGITTQLGNTPEEMLSEFFDTHIANRLIVSSKASNIDNTLLDPQRELMIRIEADNQTAFIARNALRDWCVERGINLQRQLQGMITKGLVKRDNVKKTLGADTKHASGQVRCLEIDMTKLGGRLSLVPAPVQQPAAIAAGQL